MLEPYRGKAGKDSTFFAKETIAIPYKPILTQLMNTVSHIQKEESQMRIYIADTQLISFLVLKVSILEFIGIRFTWFFYVG